MNYCLDNIFKLVLSPQILEEVKDVLDRPKFDFIDKDKKDEFILLLSGLAEIQESKCKIDVCRDKDDNKFLELAVSANVKIIVSGDNDLLDIKEYKGINILNANQFLEILKSS